MKITNPTNKEISVQYKGIVYTIPASGSISGIKDDVANYWKTMIHEFIQVSEDEITPVQTEVAPVTDEVKEEPKEIKKPVTRTKK